MCIKCQPKKLWDERFNWNGNKYCRNFLTEPSLSAQPNRYVLCHLSSLTFFVILQFDALSIVNLSVCLQLIFRLTRISDSLWKDCTVAQSCCSYFSHTLLLLKLIKYVNFQSQQGILCLKFGMKTLLIHA